ncbi:MULTISPECIES: retropepsin-like aspartic protease [Actinomadura]|uniref:Peptidase A2 domain-containing protein n=1 Tax=Actinomadura miaoliensis TaxID=430685 RepID=A0ABP7WWA8_9ACTN
MWRQRIASVVAPVIVGAVVAGAPACVENARVVPAARSTQATDLRPAVRPTPQATTVPLRILTRDGATIVLVPVTVNGYGPYDFILDTGASSSSVDRRLVDRIGLPDTGESARVRGVGGSTVAPLVRVGDWRVGGRPLHGRSLVVTDVGDDRVAGLLGSDELRRFGVITVDYARARLVLYGG